MTEQARYSPLTYQTMEIDPGFGKQPEPELIEEMIAKARMHNREDFNRLCDEFYRSITC